MNELLSGLIIGIIVLFVSPIFVRNNDEQNSLNIQSDWRNKLSKLSYKKSIKIEDLKEFRSCLSASRGFSNYYNSCGTKNKNIDNQPFDLRFNNNMSLDDTCLQYYHYINLNKKKLFKSSKNVKVEKLDEDYSHVFRLLCLLLLKSDWNNKINSNSFFHFFNYKTDYDETELKAIYLITKLTDNNKKIKNGEYASYSSRYHYIEKFMDPNYHKYYKEGLKLIEKHFNNDDLNDEPRKNVDTLKKYLISSIFIILFIVPLTVFILIIHIYNIKILDIRTYCFLLYYLIFYIPILILFIKNNNKFKHPISIVIVYSIIFLFINGFYIFENYKYIFLLFK